MFLLVVSNVLLSIIFASIIFFIYFYLLWSIFCSERIPFKPDLILTYFRFAIDVGYKLCVAINKTYYLAGIVSKIFLIKNVTFILLLPTFICATMRATLVFLISLDRLMASLFPISYYNHRHKIRTYHIVLMVFCSALLDQYFFFGYCKNVIDVPLECDNFQCIANQCYQDYWMNHEQVLYYLIGSSSGFLLFRLFVLKYFAKIQSSQLLSRATQIALLDSLIIFVFNILPLYFSANFSSINMKTVGPLTTVSKNAGSLIESIIICRVLLREKVVTAIVVPPNVLIV